MNDCVGLCWFLNVLLSVKLRWKWLLLLMLLCVRVVCIVVILLLLNCIVFRLVRFYYVLLSVGSSVSVW